MYPATQLCILITITTGMAGDFGCLLASNLDFENLGYRLWQTHQVSDQCDHRSCTSTSRCPSWLYWSHFVESWGGDQNAFEWATFQATKGTYDAMSVIVIASGQGPQLCRW